MPRSSPSRPVLLAALALAAIAPGCGAAHADDVPASPALDRLERAVQRVEAASVGVVAGVASGTIDLSTRGSDLVAAYTRLGMAVARVDRLLEKVPAEEPVPVDPATLAEGAPEGGPGAVPVAATGNHGAAPAVGPGTTTMRTSPSTGTAAMAKTTTATRTDGSTARTAAPETTTEAESTSTSTTPDKTGIASVDKFLTTVAKLSDDLTSSQKKLESARTKLTTSLDLAKKFKPEDAQAALKKKLGTGYKIKLGNPPTITPGPDATDPDIVNNLKSAITDLLAVKAAIPSIVSGATAAAQQGAAIPTQAKSEITALGPMKAADALAKVAKSTKTVTKIPKDAKDLGDEVATWTKILGG